MYNHFVHVITCTKSQLVHDIYMVICSLSIEYLRFDTQFKRTFDIHDWLECDRDETIF